MAGFRQDSELLSGLRKGITRGFVTLPIVLLVVVGLFSYLVLPNLVENQLAGILQNGLGLQEKPNIDVSSDFPPEMLLGRVDRVEARADALTQQGLTFSDVQANVGGIEVSVPGLLRGEPQVQSENCSLTAQAPPVTLDCSTYLDGYLG